MQNINEALRFNVISGDNVLISDVIDKYNTLHKTDFKIVEFIYEDLTFAVIEVSRYTIFDIFYLGFQFGGYVEHKRSKKEINW